MTTEEKKGQKSAAGRDYWDTKRREILTVMMVDGDGFFLEVEEEAGTSLLTSVEDGAELPPPAVPDGLPSSLM